MKALPIKSCRAGEYWRPTKALLQQLVPLVILLVCTTACLPVEKTQLEDLGPQVEARGWLKTNANPYALASNRFASAGEALAFVEGLYDAGAVEVLVTRILDEAWRIKAEGGPYADTLIVRLPDDPAWRRRLFSIANEEMVGEGFASENDSGQDFLLLWWD